MPVRIEVEFIGKDKLSGVALSATKSLGSFAKTAAKFGAGALTAGIVGATAAVTGLGVATFKLAQNAVPLEGIKSSFDALTESMGVGSEKMLAALQKSSGGMIANRDLMLAFNRAASLVSEDFAQRLPDAMGPLRKQAAALGVDMNFLLDSLVTGVGRLSPMILDNLGIQVKLADATERAAEMFDLEADALNQAQIQAGLMDLVIGALQEKTQAMPEQVGTAAEAFGQWNAIMANLSDELGLALLPAFNELATELLPIFQENILPLIEEYLPGFIQFVSEAAKLVAEWAEEFSKNLKPAILIIEDSLSRLSEVLTGNAEKVTLASQTLLILKDFLAATTTVVQGIALAFHFSAEAAEAAADAWAEAKEPLRDLLDIMQRLNDLSSFVPGGSIGSAFRVLGFQGGGIVPGMLGQPQLAMVHGGEMILNPQQQGQVLNNFNMTVNTSATAPTVIQDFEMMKALAG